MVEDYQPGDQVEYIAAPVFDLIIETGEVGVVTKVENGWVHAFVAAQRGAQCSAAAREKSRRTGRFGRAGHGAVPIGLTCP